MALKKLDEIEALVSEARLDPKDHGVPLPCDAMSNLRKVKGAPCGEHGFGFFIGILKHQ
jgi:hypothetical protein